MGILTGNAMVIRLVAVLVAALTFGLAMPQANCAQDGKSLEERVAELEKRVEKLEKYIEKLETELERASRRAEGEQILVSMKYQARMGFAKFNSPPATLTAANVPAADRTGKYCKVWDKIYAVKNKPGRVALIAEDFTGGFCIHKFRWDGGVGTYVWYETLDDLIKDNQDVKVDNQDVKVEDDSADEKTPSDIDHYAVYRKKGRSWTMKFITKVEGWDDFVSYSTTEIVRVADDHAVIKLTTLDKDKKPMAGLEPAEIKIEFQTLDRHDDEMPKPVIVDKTIKVEAGEFECTVFDYGSSKTWVSKKYPGLSVKVEYENGSGELVEFKD